MDIGSSVSPEGDPATDPIIWRENAIFVRRDLNCRRVLGTLEGGG